MTITRLSLCMIVRDEALWLPRCLAAARPHVDEIAVVDTGSTDATLPIAAQFGARIATFPWNGDFAAARNRSLEVASGDWILQLDADEIIQGPPGLLPQLADDAEGAQTDAYSLNLFNYLTAADAYPDNQVMALRFFRKTPDVRYAGRIHEQLNIAADRIRHVPALIGIHHYGYLPAEMRRKSTEKRNLDLLQLAVAEEKDPTALRFHLFNLARTYHGLRQLADAESLLAKVLADPESQGDFFRSVALCLRVECLSFLGRLDEALEESEHTLQQYPEYTEVLRLQANTLVRLGRFAEAENALTAALRHPSTRSGILRADPRIRAHCWADLGTLYAGTGRRHLASQCLARALLENPPLPEALPQLVEVLSQFSADQLATWLPAFFRRFPSLRPALEPKLPKG